MSGQRHDPAVFYPWGNDPLTHFIGGWMGPEMVWTQRLEEKAFASAGGRNPVV
jgi:hypothetical protein